MKNHVKNTTLYAIAFLLFFFGNAVNVIHFCCDVCRVHGTEVFSEAICHEQSGAGKVASYGVQNMDAHDGSTCSSKQDKSFPFQLTHHHESCSLSQVSITLDDFNHNVKMFITVLTITPFLIDISNIKVSKIPLPFYSSVIPLAGRQLLNKICVLRNWFCLY